MIKQPLIPAILSLVLLAAPLAALAQSAPAQQQNDGRWQQRADRDDTTRQYPGNSRFGRSHHETQNDDDNDNENDNRSHRNDGRQHGNYGSQNGNYDRQLNGRVAAFSAFNLRLNTGQQVVLHQGTIINPTGTTLQPGMRVSIYGYSTGNGQFAADEIDVIGNGYSNTGNTPRGNVLTNILGSLGL